MTALLSTAETDEPIDLRFGANSCVNEVGVHSTMAPSGECDGMLCAAATMRPVVIITIATYLTVVVFVVVVTVTTTRAVATTKGKHKEHDAGFTNVCFVRSIWRRGY